MAATGRGSSGKSITDIHCERDCYPGSEYYDGMHLYNTENDARWYPESVEKTDFTIPLSGDKRLSKAMQSSISTITAIIKKEINK